MFQNIILAIKMFSGGVVGLIKSLDELEKPLADKIRLILARAGKIDADFIAKEIVDIFQRQLCKWTKKNPEDVGLKPGEGEIQ